MIPLSQAVLCQDCDVVSDSKTDVCPACGAQFCLLNLARILEGRTHRGEVTKLNRIDSLTEQQLKRA